MATEECILNRIKYKTVIDCLDEESKTLHKLLISLGNNDFNHVVKNCAVLIFIYYVNLIKQVIIKSVVVIILKYLINKLLDIFIKNSIAIN